MFTLRIIVLILLLFNLLGCGSGSSSQRAKALTAEANNLLQQQLKVVTEWSGEYGEVFTPQNRVKFPSNRDWLRSRAERMIGHLDESSRLGNAAAEKYDQASGLVSNDKEKRELALFASSMRKDVEVNQLLKAQMRLTSDREIQDEKTFNEKFMNFMQLIKQKEKEKDDQFSEGKRLLGM